MNKAEAQLLLRQELSRYRELPYADLFSLIDHSETFERAAPSGVIYQIEMQVFVDDVSRQTLMVTGAIDDGGWRAFSPLCDDFILAPDGSFVGEEPSNDVSGPRGAN